MIFAAVAIALFFYLGKADYDEFKAIGDLKSMALQRKGVVFSALIIFISLFLVYGILPNSWTVHPMLHHNRVVVYALSIVFSFAISFCWYIYLSWLDLYERERTKSIILTFVLACFSTFLVFPLSTLMGQYTFQLNGLFWNDLQYCIFNIGMVEEFVKILPFLFVLKFTKAINESYDYILYGGVCALGFAFVENTMYLERSNLFSLNGRALYSTVSHMFDTGIICYSMAMSKHKGKSVVLGFFIGFLLASIAHGFYDFWLISTTYRYEFITIFFLLASIHIFTVMKNNLINISEFFDPIKKLRANLNKFKLFNTLLLIIFGGNLFIYLLNGPEVAHRFLIHSLTFNTYLLVFLAISFGSINIVHGYVAPIVLSLRFYLPLVNRHPNYLMDQFTMQAMPYGKKSRVNDGIARFLPLKGVLSKRIVVEGDFNWYHFTASEGLENLLQYGPQIVIRPITITHNMRDGKVHIVRIGIIKKPEDIEEVELRRNHIQMVGNMQLIFARPF